MISTRGRVLQFLERRAGARVAVSFAPLLESPRKILIIPARGGWGFPFAVPSILLLRQRFPHAAIHVLADARGAELYRAHPIVQAVHVLEESNSWRGFGSLIAAGKGLASEEFDVALWLDEEIDPERRLVVLLASCQARVGRTGGEGLFNCEYRFEAGECYPPLSQLALARRVVRAPDDERPRWSVEGKSEDKARQLVRFWKPKRGEYLFVIDPGAGISGASPSTKKLALIIENLRKTYPCQILVASEPSCDDAVGPLLEETRRWNPIRIPPENLRETVPILAQADLLVAGNTTLFHLAWVLGIPAVGLFGKLDLPRYEPPPAGAAVVVRSSEGLEARAFLEKVDRLLIGFPSDLVPRT